MINEDNNGADDISSDNVGINTSNVGLNVGLKRIEQIYNLIKENNSITAEEMATIFEVTERTIDRDISSLKKQNKLVRVGSKKAGHWEVVE